MDVILQNEDILRFIFSFLQLDFVDEIQIPTSLPPSLRLVCHSWDVSWRCSVTHLRVCEGCPLMNVGDMAESCESLKSCEICGGENVTDEMILNFVSRTSISKIKLRNSPLVSEAIMGPDMEVEFSDLRGCWQIAVPSPLFSPLDVVAQQLEGLRNASPDNEEELEKGVFAVWRFASEENRMFTGPFPRFLRMLQVAYSHLTGLDNWEVVNGQEEEEEEEDESIRWRFVVRVEKMGEERMYLWVVREEVRVE